MRIFPVAAMLLALPLAAVVACGSDTAVETDEGTVTVDRDDGTVTFSADDGSEVEVRSGKGAALPANFPEDVPVYPDATILASATSPDGIMVSCQSAADPKDVIAFYKEQVGGGGWTVDAEMNVGPQHIMSFAKGDRQLTVTVTGDPGRTQISLMASS